MLEEVDMKLKVNLTTQTILNKKFKVNVKGYDANEVDDFLDLVISDYKAYDKKIDERSAYIVELETTINTLRKKIYDLEIANASYEQRLSNIKEGQGVTLQNVEYIKRINILEEKLYALGVDPQKLK